MQDIHLIMVAGGLLTGLIAGFIMHRSDYCFAGMFSNLFLFRSTIMLKTLLLIIGVSMLLFQIIHLSGFVTIPFPFFGYPSLTNIIGGFLFGLGMVLSGGCVVGTLYKMGAGSLASALAFVGLLIGSSVYAWFHPKWAILAKSMTLPIKAVTVPQLIGISSTLTAFFISAFLIALFIYWLRNGKIETSSVVEGYIQPWKAAIILSFLGALSVLITGMPMGITTSYSKFGAIIIESISPELYTNIKYFNLTTLNYTPPLGGGVISGGPGSTLDAVSLIQFPIIFGIIAGSAISAISLGEWHLNLKLPWKQIISAILGGIIMGLASRMAPACNIWHLLGGLPILAIQSILFLLGLLPGTWLGTLIFSKVIVSR